MDHAIKWTSRGTGKCPKCNFKYSTAWKPKTCSNCEFEIGGHHVPKKKKEKLTNPECVTILERPEMSVYSLKTSPKGDRCFAVKDSNGSFCNHPTCKQSRSLAVTSTEADSLKQFSCPHMKGVDKPVRPEKEWMVSEEDINQYPCDEKTKDQLRTILINNEGGWPSVLKVATNVFVVLGPPSASSPIGYVHVTNVASMKPPYKCTSKDCKTLGYQGLGKQQKYRKFCFHLHVLLCALKSMEQNSSTSTPTSTSSTSSVIDQPNCLLPTSTSTPEACSYQSTADVIRQNSLRANSQRTLPYDIPILWLNNAKRCDALTNLCIEEGSWPLEFEPKDTVCRLCGSDLGKSKPHPGSQGQSIHMSNSILFRKCSVKVKSCTDKECKALHQIWPVEMGLFNICDKIVIALEILLEWRELFKRGVPLSTAIESKLNAWCKQCPKETAPSNAELNYWSRLLYNTFYYFEIITDRSLDDNICGLCGIIGEFYLGDGNSKNCCSLKGVKYDDSRECSPTTLEDFLSSIKDTWLEKNVFAKANQGDVVYVASSVPPIIAPALRGNHIFNTEMQKKSIYLQSRDKPTQGDPALLHHLISSKTIDMPSIETLDIAVLKDLANECSMTLPAGASKSFILGELNALYAHLLVGNSPCHGFNKVPGNTGGFYHIVCRHGTTVASKFLLLQESVRDAADLYLSLRYPPPLFILDTPCGFARHMDVRDPIVAGKLWADRTGCFEKPELGKKPSQVNVPDIVPLEYRAQNVLLPNPEEMQELEHPLTRSTDRYVMGDRFHTATEPHKSPLCEFHNLQYCNQAFTIKTSYQESENNRKNFLRLRSSTMQSFPVHFLYNYLMDFYHNENIVSSQKLKIEKTLDANQFLSRDIYHRFIRLNVDQ